MTGTTSDYFDVDVEDCGEPPDPSRSWTIYCVTERNPSTGDTVQHCRCISYWCPYN